MTLALCLALVVALIVQEFVHHRERREFDYERRLLIQRIQAPEVAVVEQAERPDPTPVQVISPLDDESLNKVRELRGED